MDVLKHPGRREGGETKKNNFAESGREAVHRSEQVQGLLPLHHLPTGRDARAEAHHVWSNLIRQNSSSAFLDFLLWELVVRRRSGESFSFTSWFKYNPPIQAI